MTKSTNTTKKTATKQPTKQPTPTEAAPTVPVDFADGKAADQKATVPAGSPAGIPKKPRRVAPVATRRFPVHYTPRIPTAHCPTC